MINNKTTIMNLNYTFQVLTILFFTLSIFFLLFGIYSIDTILITISGLFGIMVLLCHLEMKELALNPFTD